MLPLYSARSSLAAKVVTEFNEDKVTTSIPAVDIHARLYGAERHYRGLYSQTYNSDNGDKNIAACNIATASLSILFSDVSPEEGNLGDALLTHTVDIFNQAATDKRTIHVVDTFNAEHTYQADVRRADGAPADEGKRTRNRTFLEHIQTRIDNADPSLLTDRLFGAQTRIAAFALNPMFAENIHHSEQGLMETMLMPENMGILLQEINALNAETLGGFILDLHSSRPMCENCNLGILGHQKSQEGGFIHEFMKYWENDKKYELNLNFPDHDLIMNTRVSASMKSNRKMHQPLYRTTIHTANPMILSKNTRDVVLQKDVEGSQIVKKADTKKYDVIEYYGDFFTSSNNMPTARMEKKLLSLRK